ncbi:hypothetical protein RSOLAG22IIIB_09073 [Rhizoctonia solani]|uniref:AMP-dependent synthetase/ligase domain-containing protein n=1 Tax=Rhizoctonia solani TaxID=456999 RepID=A0A0K6FWW0_9AGAM|nr:hypothetical protein RSOLAG22IIIB_09073 [Rhizoctonia solani]
MSPSTEFNHIALLQHRANTSGDTILFKLPDLKDSESPRKWSTTITVAEFAAEVDRIAGFLAGRLSARGVPPRSVVSLLYSGRQYQDLLYAVALSRASYVPELLSANGLADPAVIYDLMDQAKSKVLLFDPHFEHLTANCPYPKLALAPVESLKIDSTADVEFTIDGQSSELPKIEDLSTGPDDVCFIFLTSGSTSGRPKIVPYTQVSTSTYYKSQFDIWLGDNRFDTQDVFIARGSVCSVAGMIQYLGCLSTGSSIVYPSKANFSTEEFFNLVNFGGLNRLTTYGTYLAPHLQVARGDPALLKLLQGMRTISYGGVPISNADDDWCFHNGVPIMDMYATTECGLLMISFGPSKPARYIRPVPGLSCVFDPITLTDPNAQLQLVDNPSHPTEHAISSELLTSTTASAPASTKLHEFVLLADSPQIPAPHLRSADGNLRSGDLFEQFPDGSYLLRGRDDDWIKSFFSDRTDAKAIEEKVYELCGDLVKECMVIGHLRPSPALFVTIDKSHDYIAKNTNTEDTLKELILERLKDFIATQYVHEKIQDKRLIFIVDQNALPRTNKGNFRRRGIEQKYQSELDAAYKAVYGEY